MSKFMQGIIIVFILSSIFRIFFLDLIEFKYDEAYTVFQLVQFYDKPYLMQVGPPQSTGVFNPPLFNYVMVILSFFSRDPQFLSFMVALTNSISIVGLYFVVKKFYGIKFALVTCLLLSLSPWSIVFSRKIWIPDLLLPFSVLFFFFFHKFVIEKENKFTKHFFAILVLLPQMHASGLFMLISTLPILFIARRKIEWKNALIGFSLGFIPAIPYFYRQLSSTPFCIDCQALFSYTSQVKTFDFANFLRPFEIISALNWQVLLGNSYQEFWSNLPFNIIIKSVFVLQGLVLFAGIFIILKYKQKYISFIYYLFLLPLLYTITKTPSYMHYFVILFPILFFVSAHFFIFLLEKNNALKTVGLSLLLIVFATNIIFELNFYNFLSNKKIIDGDYGPIFSETKILVDEQTKNYSSLPNSVELKNYIYMFASPKIIHAKLGEYFVQKNQINFAIAEFEKSLSVNPKDIFSRANLVYIFIVNGKTSEAKSHLDILSEQDSTISAKLKEIITQQEKQK